MTKIKQTNVAKKMSQEDFANGIGGVAVSPKQRLIEAVKDHQSLANQNFEDAKNELDTDGMASARGTISDCNHFLKLIEEILPNE